jgi:hypothetical protein
MSKTISKMKAIVPIGYHRYVMDIDDAVRLLEIMGNAELYTEVWRKEAEGGTSYHVWAQDPKSIGEHSVKPLPHSLYDMYKLAGEPNKEGA